MLKVASVAPPPWPCVLDRFCVLQIDRLISYGADILNPVTLVQGEKTAVVVGVEANIQSNGWKLVMFSFVATEKS